MKTLFLLLALLLTSLPDARAGELYSDPVSRDVTTARLVAEDDTVSPGRPIWVALHLRLKPEWHTYWINPGDTGLAVQVEPTLPQGVTLGPIHWPTPERFDIAGLINYGYHNEVYLLMPLEVEGNYADRVLPVTVKAEWLVCKDICIPEKAELQLALDYRPDAAAEPSSGLLSQLAEALPRPLPDARYNFDKTHVWLDVPLNGAALPQDMAFFPETESMVSHSVLPRQIRHDGRLALVFERGIGPGKQGFSGVLDSAQGQDYHVAATHDAALKRPADHATAQAAPMEAEPDLGLPLALILAFIGGLVLNAMPCVLPILSLKVLGLVKKAGYSRRQAALQGIAYTLGIQVSFAAVAGLLIVLQQSGSELGWGYQLQSPLFVIALTTVLFGVGLNLSGVFTLPGLFGNLGQNAAAQDTPFGSFMTGVLATLVATPCTAPFMASAIGFALTLPPAAALLVFEMLGAGLAFPYLLISLFPSLRRWLPKPGAWMEGFRQFLAFPIYATAAWLLWVLVTQAGAMALGYALLLLLLLAFAAWWANRAQGRGRKLAIVLGMLLAAGFLFQDIARLPLAASAEAGGESAERFSAARLAELREAGTPVFVNATANWCITCKVNERLALSSERVKTHFAERGIVALTADWTSRDAAIAEYLQSFGRSGVPAYIYYPPHGEPVLLPQLLTPEMVIERTGGRSGEAR